MTNYFHYSEDATIKRFEPRLSPSFPDEPPMVWAIDETHRPLYYFPRQCPRIAYWKGGGTTEQDVEAFQLNTRMVIVIEADWFYRLEDVALYQYTFSAQSFSCFDENAGYYTSRSIVEPRRVDRLNSLTKMLLNEGVELRLVPTLHKVKEEVLGSTLNFSMIRLRNARN
ncbi:DUF6886 family protein [Pseudalkalibacillus berkeleyi]|uniref:Uncharacterized protein n=1 Tax=Pseudalkalibacillus berkeleyi TaxID=1069813 RepID=A0ABS9H1Y4_9BACL|nr:DUF6886 family protein [Pseudalkalibacillus berkeleyi]MCF6138992.1 hypothetical protein [Pseudalkalibacillus berkeleyi]